MFSKADCKMPSLKQSRGQSHTLSYVCNGPHDDAFGLIFFFLLEKRPFSCYNYAVNNNCGAFRNVLVCVCVCVCVHHKACGVTGTALLRSLPAALNL